MQAFSVARPQADSHADGVPHGQGTIGGSSRTARSVHAITLPPLRRVSGAAQPALRELSASLVLALPGGKAMPALAASPAGLAVTGGDGQIPGTGRTHGVGQAIGWAVSAAGDGDAVLVAGAPLVVRDVPGQRVRQAQAGQRCGRPKVSANTTNAHSSRLAGVEFLRLAEPSGWRSRDRSRDDFGRPGRSVYRRQRREPARSSHGRRYAQPDCEQPGLTRRYPR